MFKRTLPIKFPALPTNKNTTIIMKPSKNKYTFYIYYTIRFLVAKKCYLFLFWWMSFNNVEFVNNTHFDMFN